MPNSPNVKFDFTNNNVQESTPAIGVSHVVARTTKGPFNKPDEIIQTISRFKALYGKEVVPDGSISNIERALKMGSKVRVSRVSGSGEVALGVAKSYTLATGVVGAEPSVIAIKIENPTDNTQTVIFNFNVKTKEAGSSIVDPNILNADQDFFLKLISDQTTPMAKYQLVQFKKFNAADGIEKVDILSSNQFLVATKDKSGTYPIIIDADVFQEFINNVPNITFELVSCVSAIGDLATSVTTIEDVLSVLRTYKDWFATVLADTVLVTGLTTNYFQINEGNNGGASSATTWLDAYKALLDYSDNYQVILSHVHQHLTTDYVTIYKSVADIATVNFDHILYVEIPKYNTEGEIATPEEIISKGNSMMETIGYHKNVGYFANGVMLYNESGALTKSDVLGTILGLGDANGSTPWLSFAGMNRGIIPDAKGPVGSNLGTPSKYDILNQIADSKINLLVIKDTPTMGKRTMLWHNFSSTFISSSDKFLSNVRLSLYLKKNIQPILEKYLEEPNTFSSWKNIYLEAKHLMDDLKKANAITEYNWQGDQNATSYPELQINNEADVRNGKYKIKLTYKDVTPMQEITMNFIIDSAAKSITVE